jgi:hypothetical protein
MFGLNKIKPPTSLERMEALKYPVIMTPFSGVQVPITVKELSQVEIESCGNFSLIETLQDQVNAKTKKKLSAHEISEYAETQYNILREALISPSYDEIMDTLLKRVNVGSITDQMNEIELLFSDDKLPAKDKKELQEKYAILEMKVKFILPFDFIGVVVSYALGVDKSDIKKITEDMLFHAAIKAKKGHDNPSDHISGMFTDFNKEDINNRAWIIYHDKTQKKGA